MEMEIINYEYTYPVLSHLQNAGLCFVQNESEEQYNSGSLIVWVKGEACSGTTFMRVELDVHPDKLPTNMPTINIFLNMLNFISHRNEFE